MKNRDDYFQEVCELRVSPQLRARIAAQEDRAKRGYLRSALRVAVTAACAAVLLFAAGVLWDLTHQGGSRDPVLTNPPVWNTPTPSPTKDPLPEGLISTDIQAPPKVLTAAVAFVREQFDWWSTHSGRSWYLDGQEVPVGEPAEYDSWRVTALERAWENDRLVGGCTVSAYYINWGLHTTTPERAEAICAGDMYLDEGDWFIPGGNYLLFLETGDGEYQYLTSMTIGGLPEPSDELFTDDVIRAIAEVLPAPEGTVAEGLDVPQEVLDCAVELAQDAFTSERQYRAFGRDPEGTQAPFYYPSEDYMYLEGVEAVQRPLLLDDWRIVNIPVVYEDSELVDGVTVVIYQAALQYHTSMPALPVPTTDTYFARDGWYFYSGSTSTQILCLRRDGRSEVIGRYSSFVPLGAEDDELYLDSLWSTVMEYLEPDPKSTPTPEPSPTPTPEPTPAPEGMIREDVDAPTEVMAAAVQWVKDNFFKPYGGIGDFYPSYSPSRKDPVFDNWRINLLERCYESDDGIVAYRIHFALHTTTPELMDERCLPDEYGGDGWYVSLFSDRYYLVFVGGSSGKLHFRGESTTSLKPEEIKDESTSFESDMAWGVYGYFNGNGEMINLAGLGINDPLDGIPEEIAAQLTFTGEAEHLMKTAPYIGSPYLLRTYTAPGLTLKTATLDLEWMAAQVKAGRWTQVEMDGWMDNMVEANGLVDREYIWEVTVESGDYATNGGLRPGMTVDEGKNLGYPMKEGSFGFAQYTISDITITVKDGVVTRIKTASGCRFLGNIYW